jgi:hypothetical protein
MDRVDNASAWGNLNAIVYLELPCAQFYNKVESLAAHFNPIETIFDWFDLDNNVPSEGRLDKWGSNVIGRAILEKGAEKIIVQQQGEFCCVEHLFRPAFLTEETGSAIIRKLICNNLDSAAVLGFELSISANSAQQALDVIMGDPSQYPLIVIESGKEPIEYGAVPATEPILSFLRDYWNRIS